jgi:hypothetical protein
MVGGDDGPTVAKHTNVLLAGVDHRLNGKDHAFLKRQTLAGLAVVKDLRLFMEFLADTVPTKLAHHGKTVALRERLDGVTDVPDGCARLHLANATPHGLVRDLGEPARLN